MTNKEKEYTPNLKYYHIILISFLLCPLLILNSNIENNKRNKEKLILGKSEKKDYFFGRNLEFKDDTEEICGRGSDKLKEYYSTGDPSKIGIKDEISKEDRPSYIEALINVVNEGANGNGGDALKDGASEYVKHLIPVFFFLAVAILSIPGWITCCSCCCCKCCCCCCCKNSFCKLPFYIITNVLYALVLAICIYGLSQSNSIFVGLSDTECSLLRFVGDIIEGETKEKKPKWGGVEKIKTMLTDTVTQINSIDANTLNSLSAKNNAINGILTTFETNLKSESQSLNQNNDYSYGDYILDMAKNFGEYDGSTKPSQSTFVGKWYNEYKEPSNLAKMTMDNAHTELGRIKDGEVTQSFTKASMKINDIKTSIDNVKDEISGIIIDYSETIDKYGKLGFKIVFSVLTVIDVAIAVMMFLLCFCSGKSCSSCCFFRCGLKIVLHLLWNIMSLLMIFTFLIGSIFVLVGTLGKDLTMTVSYFVGGENLGKGDNAILLGNAATKLNICINGDGNITKELDLGDGALSSFDALLQIELGIMSLESVFQNIRRTKPAYNYYTGILNQRARYETLDFGLFKNDGTDSLILQNKLDELNRGTSSIKEVWDFHKVSSTCEGGLDHSEQQYFNPDTCDPSERYSGCGSCSSFTTIAEVVSEIVKKQQFANGEDAKSIKTIINNLNGFYDNFLEKEGEGLSSFRETIHKLTSIVGNYVDQKEGFFSFLDCKFIGIDIKVLLKMLESSMGNSFYTVGVCLLLCGCSMALAISFTILLIFIISDSAGKK